MYNPSFSKLLGSACPKRPPPVINSQTKIVKEEEMFNIIPVVDLLNDEVVHAKMGQRDQYLPIQSELVQSSQPLAIVDALLSIYTFKTLYIADLNGILFQQYDRHQSIIQSILNKHPNLIIWLDNGMNTIHHLNQCREDNIVPIIGTENLCSLAQYQQLKQQKNNNTILSLDFLANGYQGPIELISNATHWPEKVIVMSLQQVGRNKGVNQPLLSRMLAMRNQQQVFAAGGVRDLDDLVLLKNMQINGVLVASALHHKKINYADVALINQ